MVPVPSVAMKLSICATSTSSPLMMPTSAPASSVAATATGQGTPYVTCSVIASRCHSTMP